MSKTTDKPPSVFILVRYPRGGNVDFVGVWQSEGCLMPMLIGAFGPDHIRHPVESRSVPGKMSDGVNQVFNIRGGDLGLNQTQSDWYLLETRGV